MGVGRGVCGSQLNWQLAWVVAPCPAWPLLSWPRCPLLCSCKTVTEAASEERSGVKRREGHARTPRQRVTSTGRRVPEEDKRKGLGEIGLCVTASYRETCASWTGTPNRPRCLADVSVSLCGALLLGAAAIGTRPQVLYSATCRPGWYVPPPPAARAGALWR